MCTTVADGHLGYVELNFIQIIFVMIKIYKTSYTVLCTAEKRIDLFLYFCSILYRWRTRTSSMHIALLRFYPQR